MARKNANTGVKRVNMEQVTHVQSESETGQVTSIEKSETFTLLHPQEPNYVKLYLDTIATFKGLSRGISPFLMEILKHMTYANDARGPQTITLTGFQREQIARNLGISDSAISKNLQKLVEADILTKLRRSVYGVNPEIFGKGDWADISKLRFARFQATLDFKAGTISADIEAENSGQTKLPAV